MSVLPSNRKARRYACDDLVHVGVLGVKQVLTVLQKQLAQNRDAALQSIEIRRSSKRALLIDTTVENVLQTAVGKLKEIDFYGEERLGKQTIDLTDREGTFALADALDGTDLFARGLDNWCSALIFFTPSNKLGNRIQAAVVGVPDGSIYFASADDEGVNVLLPGSKKDKAKAVVCPQGKRDLSSASVCFYGQKSAGLKKLVDSGFLDWAEKRNSAAKELRIYNLAGIPMIVKMIDPLHDSEAMIDVVFELRGQQAHDVVAGAFLALKAGAVMMDLEGNRLGVADLEEPLMHPNSDDHRLRYVIANSKKLADQMIAVLGVGGKS